MTQPEPAPTKTEPKYEPRSYLSVSTLVSYARCPRKYFYEKCGLRPEKRAIAAEYGTAMHAAVPVALMTEDIEPSLAAFKKAWRNCELYLEQNPDEDRKKCHTSRHAERSLKHFIHTHKGDRSLYKLLPPPNTGVELVDRTTDYQVAWSVNIDLPVPLGGLFDGMCEHRHTGDRWIWELKTTSRLNAAFLDAHDMFCQNLTYTLAAKIAMDEKVPGVMLEAMLKDKNKVDNQTHPILVPDHHLTDILDWLRMTGTRLLDAERFYLEHRDEDPARAVRAFIKDFTGCTPLAHYYMSGFRCDYSTLCRVPEWESMWPVYNVVPDHKLLKVTVDADAKKSS